MKNEGASILVVDDTPANLKVLVQMLQKNGYKPRPVPSGQHALRAVEYELPDLILMDINMPVLDGISTCTKLKENHRYRNIPVIFVSALTDTFDKVKAFEAGGVDYITKPFDAEEVITRIENHLKIRNLQVEQEEDCRQLQELEVLRDRVTNMAIHDMSPPLLVIRSALGLLSHRLSDVMDSESREDINDALAGANMLAAMVDRLLDMCRLEDDGLVLKIERCNLAEIVNSVAELLTTRSDTRRDTRSDTRRDTRSDTHDESTDRRVVSPHIYCDEDVIRPAIASLLGSTLKFTQRGGEICVSIAGHEDQPQSSVQEGDTGNKKRERSDSTPQGRHLSSDPGLTFCLSDLPPEFRPN
tara:strand:- start:4988 stop:6058 length:1071 start_codon:yes stop_codon:yes gene_type:complete